MHTATATATASALLVLLSTLSGPALAQYGGGSGSSTSTASVAAGASTVASSSSPTHTVQVGANGFVFTPDSVTAAKGDVLEFHFTGTNLHDVVEGSFSAPCSDNNGIYSGYPSTSDVFQVMVNSTSPMWLYCSTPGHCQGGMAMVVNQASTGSNTLDAYKSAAQGTSSSNAPANVQGGTVVAISALSASASGSSPTATMSSTATMSGAASSSTTAGTGAADTVSSSFKNMVLAAGIPALVWLLD